MDPTPLNGSENSAGALSEFATAFDQLSYADPTGSQHLVVALRLARQEHPGKTVEDLVVVRRLVRAVLGAGLSAMLGGNSDQLETTIAETLMADPAAMERLRVVWERSAEPAP